LRGGCPGNLVLGILNVFKRQRKKKKEKKKEEIEDKERERKKKRKTKGKEGKESKYSSVPLERRVPGKSCSGYIKCIQTSKKREKE
jgi:hypothetical protein